MSKDEITKHKSEPFLIRNPAVLERAAGAFASVRSRSFCGSGGLRIRDTSLIFLSTAHRRGLLPGAAQRKRVMAEWDVSCFEFSFLEIYNYHT